jgi:Beta-lactamase class C and other penicillin binding proteins
MQRREFLHRSGSALIGVSLLPANASGHPVGYSNTLSLLIADLESKIPALMAETKVPGLSIVLIRDATIAWRKGFGLKDASSNARVDTDTMFEAASMSKPVFAYAVMKLCERDVLNLDTPLVKYTGERLIKDDPRSDRITARQILSHTSGLQDWRSDTDPLSIHFEPGQQYLYSGEGYAYLQSVVALLTGKPFETWMVESILTPFHMYSSSYVWNALAERQMARGHDEQGKPMPYRRSTPADVARYGSSGALLTTPSNYARFLIEVIHPAFVDALHLNSTSLAEMLRPQVKIREGSDYSVWWGLGWRVVRTSNGGQVIGHGGENPGFQCISEASLVSRSGFVIMTNGQNGAKLIERLAPPLAQKLYELAS